MLKNIKMRVCKRYIRFKKGIKRISDRFEAHRSNACADQAVGPVTVDLKKNPEKIKNYKEEDLKRAPQKRN